MLLFLEFFYFVQLENERMAGDFRLTKDYTLAGQSR